MAAVAVLLLGMMFLAPGCAKANPLTIVVPAAGYGFSVGRPMTTMSAADAEGELDAAAKTGASWLRVIVDWAKIEPSPGTVDWDYMDRWTDGAVSRGLKILGVFVYTPDWARAPGATTTGPPTDPVSFATFATKVVQRYGDRISHWEIWNEPNSPTFFGGLDNRPQRYTELLKAAYTAIKATQPSSTIVAAGLSRLRGQDTPSLFVDAMYAAGVKGYFDAMAMHPFVFPGGVTDPWKNGWSDVEAIRKSMVEQGDGDKKIWLTELGAPTCDSAADGVSQEEQARQIIDVLQKAAGSGYTGPAFIYSIRDTNTAIQDDPEENYGALLTSDWQPKIAATVLAR